MMKLRRNCYLLVFYTITMLMLLSSCEDNPDSDKLDQLNKLLVTIEDYSTDSPEYFEMADSAYRISLHINSAENRQIEKSLHLLGNYYFAIGKYDEAVSKYKLALQFHGGKKPDSILGESYNKIGRAYFRKDEDSLAIENFKKAAYVRMQIPDSTGYGTSMNNTGFVFWSSSQFDSALVYFEKALAVREKLPNIEHLSSTLNNIGTIYYNWSIYDKALDYYSRVLSYVKELNDKGGEANALSNIGLVYLDTDQPENAREYFREAVSIATAARDSQRIGYAYTNLAATFFNSDVDSALYYYEKSDELYEVVGFKGGQLMAKEGIGRCYLEVGDIDKAEHVFKHIRDYSKELNIRLRYAQALQYLGRIEIKKENYSESIELLKQSNEIARVINTKYILVNNYRYLSEIFEKIGNIEEAFDATKKYLTYKNEIDNEDMKRRLDESKKQFEVEKVRRMMDAAQYRNERQQIILIFTFIVIATLIIMLALLYRAHIKRTKAHKLLYETNSKIEAQKAELNKTNRELLEVTKTKDKFYSIIAHDLKNPFISLYGYTEILKNEYYTLSDEEKLEFITELELTTKKTFGLLQNLLELSALQTGKMEFNPGSVTVTNVAESIIDVVKSQAKSKGIKINNDISPGFKVYADKTMVEVVIRNLLTNAVKFTHPGGAIKLGSSVKDSEVTVSIKDNGVGMPSEVLDSLINGTSTHSTRGTNDEKGSGLGIEICREFIKKNNGKFWAESVEGQGSTFYFTLPGDTSKHTEL